MLNSVLGLLAALVGGITATLAGLPPPWWSHWGMAALWLVGLGASVAGVRIGIVRHGAILACVALGGASLASDALRLATQPSLRLVLDSHTPGFLLDDPWSAPQPQPIATRVTVVADPVRRDDSVAVRVAATAVRISDAWVPVEGAVALTVGGGVTPSSLDAWSPGVSLELPIAFRRPARFFNAGVPNAERVRALGGTALVGSVKSALLVQVVGKGPWLDRMAAQARHRVRRAVARARLDEGGTSTAILRAVLIGDDGALPSDLRDRWQAAGAYHVLAISGGNIVVVVLMALALARLSGCGPRIGTAAALGIAVAFGLVVVPGASVRRAVWMAAIHLSARLLDHRASPWKALGSTAFVMLATDPLSARDPGFLLTCGATAALVACQPGVHRSTEKRVAARSWSTIVAWLSGGLLATLAVEAAVLPIGVAFFNQVSLAGLGLNLLAVPTMTAVQVIGLAIVVADAVGIDPRMLGWLANALITGLDGAVAAASNVAWLAWRAPTPPTWLLGAYYLGLAVSWWGGRRWLRRPAAAVAGALALAMVSGEPVSGWQAYPDELRVTMLDVGQGEAVLVEADGHGLLVDTGGRPFGDVTDVGQRVVVPALWALGVRWLDGLLVTHGDPDHIGGAVPVLNALRVRHVWQGVVVPSHPATEHVIARATARGARVAPMLAGTEWQWGRARVRVLHPPAPDWERRRVRNDDSVVVEVRYGEVTVLLTGDISADVERSIAPLLRPARIRILKVAHHGSRTSTSPELVDAFRPQVALISCGRGNTFGHPADAVLQRLRASEARVFRTDQDGQVRLRSDGHSVWVDAYRGRSLWVG